MIPLYRKARRRQEPPMPDPDLQPRPPYLDTVDVGDPGLPTPQAVEVELSRLPAGRVLLRACGYAVEEPDDDDE